jgi:beta-aspartyl-peptidase (threonine type)
MDAAIMKGDLSCGAVADQNLSYRSISLARIVMERTDHVLMVGTASIQKLLNSLGESFEDQRVLPSFDKIERYRRLLSQYSKKGSEWPRNKLLLKDYMQKTVEVSDTVGAVALDLEGNVCAGVSTGGRWMKLPGRVGDSALIGAGLYADKDSGAISATGVGEEIIRLCLSKMVSDAMKTEGMDAQAACQLAIKTLTRVRGTNTAGLIAIDKAGRVGRSCNTPALPTAVRLNGMDRAMVVLFANEDLRIA